MLCSGCTEVCGAFRCCLGSQMDWWRAQRAARLPSASRLAALLGLGELAAMVARKPDL